MPAASAALEALRTSVATDDLDAIRAAFTAFEGANDKAHEPDSVGRIHIERVPISKANVCPYKGSEIPRWEELGLEPETIYQLLRDPEELAKAAPTFNGIQLLHRHTPVSVGDHKPDDIVGTTGTHAEFEDPYLYNTLSLWAQHAIDGVEDESKREISSSYQYDPDMTPGTYQGQKYDGVMRNIRGNHVAIVTKGRAGPDVAIDEALPDIPPVKKDPPMTKKTAVPSRTAARLNAALSALAMDEKFDAAALVKGVTAKNLKARKPALAKAIKVAFDGLDDEPAAITAGAATGATPDDVILKVLDMVEGQTAAEPPEADEQPAAVTDPNAGPPAAAAGGEMDKAKLMEWLKAKGMSDDDMSELDGMYGSAEDEDETDEEKAARLKKEAGSDKAKDAESMVSKTAMDQAIAANAKAVEQRVLKTQRDIAQATAYVRPWVGELAMDEAITDAPSVYRKALQSLKIEGADDMHPDALKAVLDAQPKPGERKREPRTELAMDAASADSYAKRFPAAMRVDL